MTITRTDVYSNGCFRKYNVNHTDLYATDRLVDACECLPELPITRITFDGIPENYTVTTQYSDFNTTGPLAPTQLTDATTILGTGGYNGSLDAINARLDASDALLLGLAKEDTTTTLASYENEQTLLGLRNESAADFRKTQLEGDKAFNDVQINRDNNLLKRSINDNETNERIIADAQDGLDNDNATNNGGGRKPAAPREPGSASKLFDELKGILIFMFQISLFITIILSAAMIGHYVYEKYALKCTEPEFLPRAAQTLLGLEINKKEDICRTTKAQGSQGTQGTRGASAL
jgi:hypothetical protein